jgi:hypothetical protein
LNETFVTSTDSGRVVFGLQFGNWLRPKEFRDVTHPVPVDVPRVRYQLLTRRVGNSAPIADAGPDQIGIQAGTVTLNGALSVDLVNGYYPAPSVTYTVVATVDPSATGTLSNIVTATAAGDINTANDSATDTDTISQVSDVSVSKTDGVTSVVAGHSTTYTITETQPAGFIAVAVSLLIGVTVGAISGYFGGWVDNVIMRIVDAILCFPTFFLILTAVALLGPNIINIIVVIGLVSWTGTARLVRADVADRAWARHCDMARRPGRCGGDAQSRPSSLGRPAD